MPDEERLFAWLDGELGEEDAAIFAERVRTSARLRQLADQHLALKQYMSQVFEPIAGQPLRHIGNIAADNDDEPTSKQA